MSNTEVLGLMITLLVVMVIVLGVFLAAIAVVLRRIYEMLRLLRGELASYQGKAFKSPTEAQQHPDIGPRHSLVALQSLVQVDDSGASQQEDSYEGKSRCSLHRREDTAFRASYQR